MRWLISAAFILLVTTYPHASGDNGQKDQLAVAASVTGVGSPTSGGGSGLNNLLGKSNSGEMVNEFTGQIAFNVELGGISAQNGLAYGINMSYYGGTEALEKTHVQYAPGGWVGAGFSLRAPNISVSGVDARLDNQKYFLSLDGNSSQELLESETPDVYFPKGNPTITVTRLGGPKTNTLVDRCPSQTGQTFSFDLASITGWIVRLPNGTEYHFGGGSNGNCDASEYEMCQPVISNNYKYKPFYTLQANGKSAQIFFLAQILDREAKSSIFFRYDKVQESVAGSCNYINSTTAGSTVLDRAAYLKEIYSVNGTQSTDFKTSQIVFNTSLKTEESVYNPTLSNVSAFYETKKLSNIQYFEKGNLIKTLNFNYITGANRMLMDSISIKAPQYSETKLLLHLTYAANSTQISSFKNGTGQIAEFAFGPINSDKIGNSSPTYQEMDLGVATSIPNTRVTFAQQIGNKFYVETENWSSDCLTANATQTTFDARKERLFEYENNGTHWALKRTITAPGEDVCPTNVDFFMGPDGSYFIWAARLTSSAVFHVYDLTDESPVPRKIDLPFTIDHDAINIYAHNNFFTFPNWFVVQNSDRTNELFFYSKQSNGTWVANPCPSGLAPGNYAISSTSPRTNNFSGEYEFDDNPPTNCPYYSNGLVLYQGSNFLVANDNHFGILHVFGYDNGEFKDYVRGLETTTPYLGNFTSSDVDYPADNPTLIALPRPWFRHTDDNTLQRYDNNWTKVIDKIVVSDNFILVESEADGNWRYLYVFGWDGKQLRYLYDQPLHCDKSVSDKNDAIDFAAGPDYFVLKNHYSTDAAKRGFFYYKVDLTKWSVSKSRLAINTPFDADNEDWVIKTYPDYFFLEKMQQNYGSTAFSPAMTTYASLAGVYYKSANESYVYMLDESRNPVDVSSNFHRTGTPNDIYTANFSGSGDRILGIDVAGTGTSVATGAYSIWKKTPNDATGFSRTGIVLTDNGAVHYHTARLVSSGSMVTMYVRDNTEESLNCLRFFPDLKYVPYVSDPSLSVPGAMVVKTITLKTAGVSSTGNNVQTINLTYPTTSPEGVTAKIVVNNDSKVPNFKYVKKELTEGAIVTGYQRDEYDYTLDESEKNMVGTKTRTWTLPDKVTFKKPAGGWDSIQYMSANLIPHLNNSWQLQVLRDSSRSYFHSAHKGSVQYTTDYDSKNGQPKVTIAKVAGKYIVNLSIFQHELTPYSGTNFALLRQTAVFQFSTDPCTNLEPDRCSNVIFDPTPSSTTNWFTSAVMTNIVASTITTYDASERVQDVYQWRADALGSVYPPLNGDPTSTGTGWKWVKVNTITKRQDQGVARCNSDAVTESNQMGVFTTNFYGGSECDLLGTVQNSALFSSALLTGEEDIKTQNCAIPGACLGAFGRWEAGGGVIQSQVVHTGDNAIKVTGQYGPTINLQIRQAPGFMDRKKGFFVSAWILASANSNPAFAIEFRKSNSPPTPALGDPVVYSIDVVQEYITAKGAFPTGKWVKVERMISFDELSSNGVFTSTPSYDYLRIWIGKSSSANTNPVYVDDVRLHPADAMASTQNFNSLGQISSSLDSKNEPTFFEYDIWGNQAGVRGKDGMVHTTNAVKLFDE